MAPLGQSSPGQPPSQSAQTRVPGVLQPTVTDASVSSVTSSPDVVVTGTLLNINDAVTVALSGRTGAGVFIPNSGALQGIVTPEVSADGGTTWVGTYFIDPATGQATTTALTVTGLTNIFRHIAIGGGITHVRVRLSAAVAGSSGVVQISSSSAFGFTTCTPANQNAQTYVAATTDVVTAPNGSTPFFSMSGSGSTTVRVQWLRFSVSGGVNLVTSVRVRKTSSATSGGTSTNLTQTPLDSTDNAATLGLCKVYTVAPTAGTLVGVVAITSVLAPINDGTGHPVTQIFFDWRGAQAHKPPVLRGTAECLEASFGSAPGASCPITAEACWIEEHT